MHSHALWNILCTLLYRLDIIQCENRIITIYNERKPLMHFLLYKSSMKDWKNTCIDPEDRYVTSQLKVWRHASAVRSRDETRVPTTWLVKGWRWRWLSYIQKHLVRLINLRTPSLFFFFHPDDDFIFFFFFFFAMEWMNDFHSSSHNEKSSEFWYVNLSYKY